MPTLWSHDIKFPPVVKEVVTISIWTEILGGMNTYSLPKASPIYLMPAENFNTQKQQLSGRCEWYVPSPGAVATCGVSNPSPHDQFTLYIVCYDSSSAKRVARVVWIQSSRVHWAWKAILGYVGARPWGSILRFGPGVIPLLKGLE